MPYTVHNSEVKIYRSHHLNYYNKSILVLEETKKVTQVFQDAPIITVERKNDYHPFGVSTLTQVI